MGGCLLSVTAAVECIVPFQWTPGPMSAHTPIIKLKKITRNKEKETTPGPNTEPLLSPSVASWLKHLKRSKVSYHRNIRKTAGWIRHSTGEVSQQVIAGLCHCREKSKAGQENLVYFQLTPKAWMNELREWVTNCRFRSVSNHTALDTVPSSGQYL